jgi:hypothetical protein
VAFSFQASHVDGRFLAVDRHISELDEASCDSSTAVMAFEDAEESNKMYVTIATIRDWIDQPGS